MLLFSDQISGGGSLQGGANCLRGCHLLEKASIIRRPLAAPNSIISVQQSSSPAVQQSSSPAVQQSSSPAVQQSSSPAVQQSSSPAIQARRIKPILQSSSATTMRWTDLAGRSALVSQWHCFDLDVRLPPCRI